MARGRLFVDGEILGVVQARESNVGIRQAGARYNCRTPCASAHVLQPPIAWGWFCGITRGTRIVSSTTSVPWRVVARIAISARISRRGTTTRIRGPTSTALVARIISIRTRTRRTLGAAPVARIRRTIRVWSWRIIIGSRGHSAGRVIPGRRAIKIISAAGRRGATTATTGRWVRWVPLRRSSSAIVSITRRGIVSTRWIWGWTIGVRIV